MASRPGAHCLHRACGLRALLSLLWLLVAACAPGGARRVTVACDRQAPAGACARLRAIAGADPQRLAWSEDPALANVRLGLAGPADPTYVGTWTYAVAAPFFTVDDDVTSGDLLATWRGQPAGPFSTHPLLASSDTVRILSLLWGPPADGAAEAVDAGVLLDAATRAGAWAIVPFDELEPAWKVLRVDGISLLEKGLEGASTVRYPLEVRLVLVSEAHPEAVLEASRRIGVLSNRQESRMTVVAMTGVTALARGTARTMEEQGIDYPGRDIAAWLTGADFTHISNEVSFSPDCPGPAAPGTTAFCSDDRYIELLDSVGTDIVELTGNHLLDYGQAPLLHTLDLYRSRGWRWYGGGANLADATHPLTLAQGPNRLAFLGCNPAGPKSDWATARTPGSAPCNYTQLQARVKGLRASGYLPIVTLQYLETYQYTPTPGQAADFRAIAAAGAAVVQGSQAHQPQAIEFYGGAFVHYGLGNLFFDQMESPGTRQEFVDRLVFYDGSLLSVDLRTALLEDYARPRPMTAEERREFLGMIFSLRP